MGGGGGGGGAEPRPPLFSSPVLLRREHAQGVKQLVCLSVAVVVVVVVGTKITRYRILGICECCKHNQSVDIGEKVVSWRDDPF